MTLLIVFSATIFFLYLNYYIFKTLFNFRRLRQEGVKAKGIITGFKTIKNRNSKETYMPTVQFRTHAGIEIIGNPLKNYNEDEYVSAAKEVEVIYLSSNPKTFMTEGQKFDYSSLLIVLLMFVVYPITIRNMIESDPKWLNDLKQFFDKF